MDIDRNLVWHGSQVNSSERIALLGQLPRTLWLTGLSGSGKSTLAFALERHLIDAGHCSFVLDGDNVRHGLNRNLGFSPTDRTENIRRIAEVARLMNEAGLIVITAFISPYRTDRKMAAEIIGEVRFSEIYISTPLSLCEQRDPKGLYRRARNGEVREFTGIDSPYEPPEFPALALDTGVFDVRACVDQLRAAALC
ncbi:adenylyl-sulfate kinase [Dechloromonas denitrificans]|uniref:Adenylyl-sulfate kinase n=1 Tax=Dechloromonas denitrificans TaxID=281362 RepID=A0A133XGR4_9RHOO|nr:adenylyl-sulfate kinase [Dechloromonas denitrificans]KXB30128.1 adenylyl-sulfate kinase [Dechloromonas denitrificans]